MATQFPKLNVDLKKLFKREQVENLSKHFTAYEQRVKELVKELDLKSRDAREKSKEKLAQFTSQVRKTSTGVEKNVKDLLHQEGKVLNQKLNDLVTYLKSLAAGEKQTAAPVATASAQSAKAKKSGGKKAAAKTTGAPRAKRASKKSEASPAPQA